jgi:hypothetical protein
MREREITALLQTRPHLTIAEMVVHMYPALPYALKGAATRTVALHVQKLMEEGQIEEAKSGSGQIFSFWGHTSVYQSKPSSIQ